MINEDKLDEKLKYAQLFSIYGNLLTDRQRDVFQLYCYQDLSLSEISADLSISRQAVHDAIHRSQDLLLSYEDKLNFLAMHKIRQQNVKLISLELEQLKKLMNTINEKHSNYKEHDVKNTNHVEEINQIINKIETVLEADF